ncbi:prostatic acid phosphatase isoform X1 [Spodoptera litura]|uniref:acid phosphatase n=1 Tax=Spodoptera litura TaxID=69820 RepID=A0A9J7J2S8_SPOLT|nr:prostatic acid phosphatase isoform X1 [Spodoptera litura]
MISFLLFVIFSTNIVADESVKYAAVIFRHGDRTPVQPYPTDPWRNESLWPVKFGELTNVGKRQHYALGKWLRQRYSHLLSDAFDPTEIYIRSTDIDRTLMSAQANLAGMYPPKSKTMWNPDINWQPIPVHTVPELEDELLAMRKPCPAYDTELERVMHSKPYKERLRKYQHLMDYLSAYSGMKVKDYYDIVDIYSTLYIETLYNFTLPNWTQSVYPDEMREPACYSFKTETGSPLLSRLKVGPLLKHIMTHMSDVLSGDKKSHKVVMYSGHDLTVGSILNALGLYDGNCPVYTSTVFLELVKANKTGEHFVRISYRNSTEIVEPYILKIPFCGEVCPLERFKKLYDNLISVNWEEECKKQFPALLGASFIVGLCLFITIYVVHKIHFARVYKQYRSVYIPRKNLSYQSIQKPTVMLSNPLKA